jgi:hypothetical protein
MHSLRACDAACDFHVGHAEQTGGIFVIAAAMQGCSVDSFDDGVRDHSFCSLLEGQPSRQVAGKTSHQFRLGL